ncbi:hypothetical protein [Pasteurella sp. PK-2025]|uniref:hypothetical protein n=1 Tax=unclassified Pasteurella TaxID=2621516 RepID=UPI003C78792B
MKKLTIISVVLALVACGEKDQAYYLKNPEKAEAKFKQCRAQIDDAFRSDNEEAYKKIKNDAECNAARAAFNEHRRQQEEKERLAREAEEKALIDEAKKTLQAEFGKLEWQDFATQYVNTECAGTYIKDSDYRCRGFKSLYEEKVAEGLAQLSKVAFDDLKNQEKQYCSRDKRSFSACDIWKKAFEMSSEKHFSQFSIEALSPLREQNCTYDAQHNQILCSTWEKVYNKKSQDVIDNYVKNYESLKKDYNQCVQRLAEMGNDWKNYKKRQAVSDYYPCAQAQKARSQLGLSYDNFKTLME